MTSEDERELCDVTFMDTDRKMMGTIKMHSKPKVDKELWWGQTLYYVREVAEVHWRGEPCHHIVAVISKFDDRWNPSF